MSKENIKQKSITHTEAPTESRAVSSVKFFLIWFGVPLAFVAFIAWKIAHS